MKAKAEKVSKPQVIYGKHETVDRFGWSIINWGTILSWVIVLTPLALWLPRYSFTELWSLPGLYVTLAKIGSLTGTAMMGWGIILSARYRWLDRRFKGLDKMYKLHHTFGALAFCGILWHAFWLTVKVQTRSGNGLGLWLSDSPEVQLGVLALALFVVFIFFTAMVKMSYDNFVRVHRFLGVMFIIASTHAFAVNGQMDVNPPLFWYMLGICGFAILSFVYHSIFTQLLKLKYRYKVYDVHHYGGDVVEVCLERRGRPMTFAPGQFAYLSFDVEGLTESHPYSMSSGYRERLVRFTIKSLGDYTTKLMELKKGTKAYLEGPFGGFSYLNGRRKRQIWVAGGIGITPFLSMARSFKRGYHCDLYYCVKTESEMVFAEELFELDAKNPGFHLVPICQDKDGFISASTITKISGEVADKDFFFCGPPVMTDALTAQLKELGVTDEQIHTEDFRY